MSEMRIFSENIATPDGLARGEAVIVDGNLAAVEPCAAASPGALNWGADWLIPGLVDIHTDNFEKHYQPRPGALWDAYGAALGHDGQCAAAGVTTVFDSLSLHGRKDGLDRSEALEPMIFAMDTAEADGVLRAEHLLHLRCEVTNPLLLTTVEPFLDHPRLKLISVTDHTPGQRQTANVERMRERMAAHGRTADEIAEMTSASTDWRDPSVAAPNRRSIVALAHEFGLPLASHDDATPEHVEESHADGCVIAEFPVTIEAARLSRERRMWIVMGGPNFVRGSSHSGNLSAREAAAVGLLDIIASDYVPLSMLRTAFQLIDDFGWTPQAALATVAKNPARSVGLTDRGEIAAGQRADLVRVRRAPCGWPAPAEVWRQGRRVA
jgi:alpha-D-ribose 1-methylphosphonate 5-triphosphate diphosphatase